ncbi:hypothetical protein VIGAN_09099400 [Vigna angularis var. angularis]|uniref:Uncharacterized protein n=1 Tax=Vigna angularis var. angularis TaxID=157739 RepID=A0A0S3SXE3_PHAAN|nr:hypothetical protein VIGAN_09099400 [Vigna angularis var. angularis]
MLSPVNLASHGAGFVGTPKPLTSMIHFLNPSLSLSLWNCWKSKRAKLLLSDFQTPHHAQEAKYYFTHYS